MAADPTFAYDATFDEAFDVRNDAHINGGVGVCKYPSKAGKMGGSEPTAEAMAWFCRLLDEGGVIWQSATQGAVDRGGGGTVTMEIENRNITSIDIGTPVISMHTPMELASKLDLYMTQKAMRILYAAQTSFSVE